MWKAVLVAGQDGVFVKCGHIKTARCWSETSLEQVRGLRWCPYEGEPRWDSFPNLFEVVLDMDHDVDLAELPKKVTHVKVLAGRGCLHKLTAPGCLYLDTTQDYHKTTQFFLPCVRTVAFVEKEPIVRSDHRYETVCFCA